MSAGMQIATVREVANFLQLKEAMVRDETCDI